MLHIQIYEWEHEKTVVNLPSIQLTMLTYNQTTWEIITFVK